MSRSRDALRRLAAAAAVRRRRRSLAALRPGERLDPALALVVAATLAGFAAAGFGLATWEQRDGAFDPPVLRPLPDDRILANLRDHDAPFADAATLGGDAVLLARRDGTVHLRDATTGLIRDERIPREADGLVSDIATVSPSCGFGGGEAEDCPFAGEAFAVTEGGGLAMRGRRGDWRVLSADVPWIDPDGEPVEQPEIVDWAVDDAGRHLLLLAGEAGAALFDLETGRWRVPDGQGPLRGAGAQRALAVRRGFLIGSDAGIGAIDPAAAEATLRWSADRDVAVTAMDRTPEGEALAILEAPCEEGAETCLTLARIEDPDRRVRLFGERMRDGDLSALGIAHAALQSGKVVTLGAAGVHAYDPAERGWLTLVEGAVDAHHAVDGGRTIVAAIGPRVVRVVGARIAAEWTRDGAPFAQLQALEDGRVLALDRDGAIHELTQDRLLAPRDAPVPDGVAFTSGASIGDRVLLQGPQGRLVHDVAARRFSWVPDAGVAGSVVAAGGRFWSVDAAAGRVALLSLEGEPPTVRVTSGASHLGSGSFASVSGGPDALFVIDPDLGPVAVRAAGPDRLLATPALGATRTGGGTLVAAADMRGSVAFASDAAVWIYDEAARGWSGPLAAPAGERIRDLAASSALLVLTDRGRVHRLQSNGWAAAFGSGDGARIALAAVTDALIEAGGLYVAGDGQVQRYDVAAGRWDEVWAGGAGPVRLAGVEEGVPVWLSDGVLRHGTQPMTGAEVLGAWRAPDGWLAHAAERDGRGYALRFPTVSGPAICSHRGVEPPRGRLIDAVGLPGDRLLAVFTDGAFLRLPVERRWARVEGLIPEPGLRLSAGGGWLLATTPQRLRALPLNGLASPESCETSVRPPDGQSVEARSVESAGDASAGALLDASGSVRLWREGRTDTLLGAVEPGPRPESLRRVAVAGRRLFFTAADRLWAYDARARRWSEAASPVASPIEIDAAPASADLAAVTVWDRGGGSHGGVWRVGEALALEPLDGVRLPRIDLPPAELRDMAARDGLWAAATGGRVLFGRRDDAALAGSLGFGSARPSPTPHALGGVTAFVEGPAAAPERLWLLPAERALGSMSGRLVDAAFEYAPSDDRAWGLSRDDRTLWRIARDGAILRCPLAPGARARERCEEALPPPMRLDPADLMAAHRDGLGLLLVTRGGLVSVDQRLRDPRPITGPSTGPDTRLFRSAGELWLWEGPGGALWRLPPAAGRAERAAPRVDRLARVGDDLRLLAGGRVLDLSRGGGAPDAPFGASDLRAFGVDWAGDVGGVLALDARGRVVDAADGAPLGDAPVPRAETVARVLAAPRREGRPSVWVQHRDGGVQGWEERLCAADPLAADAVYPCWQRVLDAPFEPPAGAVLLSVGPDGDVLSFDGAAFGVDRAARSTAPVPPRRMPEAQLPTLTDETAAVRRALVAGAGDGGVAELDPPQIRTEDGRSVLRTETTPFIADVVGELAPWAPLDLGWLAWRRDARRVSFEAMDGGRIDLPASEALRDGLLLPAHPGRAAFRPDGAGDGHAWLTRHGLWLRRPGGDGAAAVRIAAYPEPVGLARGRFLLPDGMSVDPLTGAVAPDGDRHVVAVDALRLEERLRARRVEATLSRTDGSRVGAFAATGFAHDRRTAVGWRGGAPALITPVGIVPTSDLVAVDPPPGAGPARLVDAPGGTFARAAGGWFRLGAGGAWTAAPDPSARRQLARLAGTLWRLDGGRLEIEPIAPEDAWRTRRDGMDFAADRLIGTASDGARVLIATGLGVRELPASARLAEAGPADDVLPSGGRRLDALEIRPGDPAFFAVGADALWDPAARRWRPAPPDRRPWAARRAVDALDLRIDLRAGGSPAAARRVETPSGASRFAGFSWGRGDRMPFDIATALHAEGGAVRVGAAFGLRDAAPTGAPLARILDPSAAAPDATGPAEAIRAVGRPETAPARLVAAGVRGGCLDLAGPAPRVCGDPGAVEARRALAGGLWSWTERDGALEGRYTPANGPELPIPPDPGARWPHDDLAARLVCEGRTLELWSGGRVLRRDASPSAPAERLPAPVERLHCQTRAAPLGAGLTLPAGPWAVGPDGALSLTGGAATPAPPRLAAETSLRAAGGVAWEADDLRVLATGPKDALFLHRTEDDVWRRTPWTDGLPAFETRLGLLAGAGGSVEAITAVGLLPLHPDPAGGGLRVDPDALRLATPRDAKALLACRPDRVERADGRSHGAPDLPGRPALWRCADGRVFEGPPASGPRVGGIAPRTGEADAFAVRDLVDEGPAWRWRVRSPAGATPRVEIALHGEGLSLSAGRLSADDLRDLATPFPREVNVVAGDGLRTHAAGDWTLLRALRPPDLQDAAAVTAATSDRSRGGRRPLLCVRTGAGSVLRDDGGEVWAAPVCEDWRGFDGLWEHRRAVDGGVSAEAEAENGPVARRTLRAGRLDDYVVDGAPLGVLGPSGPELLAPGPLGVVVRAEGGRPQAIHAMSGVLAVAALPEGAGPTALSRSGAASLLQGEPGPEALCPGWSALAGRLPETARVLEAERLPGGRLRLRLSEAADPRLIELDCAEGAVSAGASRRMDARPRHAARLRPLLDAGSDLTLTTDDVGAVILGDGRRRRVRLDAPRIRDLEAVEVSAGGRDALLVGRDAVYLLDVDAALSQLAEAVPARDEGDGGAEPPPSTPAARPAPADPSAPPDPGPAVPPTPPPPLDPPAAAAEPGPQPAPTVDPADAWPMPAVEMPEALRLTVQRRLRAAGLYRGRIDAIFGPRTRAAIEAWQRDRGEEPSGVLTRGQLRELLAEDEP